MNSLLIAITGTLLLAFLGLVVALSSDVVDRALYRWSRYELRWDFDNPYPHPNRFWTLRGAQKSIGELKNDTEDMFYVYDRKKGRKL